MLISMVPIMVERSQCSFHSTISISVMKHPLWSNRTPLGELDFHTSYSTQKGFIKHPTFNSVGSYTVRVIFHYLNPEAI